MTDSKSKFRLAKPFANGLVLLAFLTVLSPIGVIMAGVWLIQRLEGPDETVPEGEEDGEAESRPCYSVIPDALRAIRLRRPTVALPLLLFCLACLPRETEAESPTKEIFTQAGIDQLLSRVSPDGKILLTHPMRIYASNDGTVSVDRDKLKGQVRVVETVQLALSTKDGEALALIGSFPQAEKLDPFAKPIVDPASQVVALSQSTKRFEFPSNLVIRGTEFAKPEGIRILTSVSSNGSTMNIAHLQRFLDEPPSRYHLNAISSSWGSNDILLSPSTEWYGQTNDGSRLAAFPLSMKLSRNKPNYAIYGKGLDTGGESNRPNIAVSPNEQLVAVNFRKGLIVFGLHSGKVLTVIRGEQDRTPAHMLGFANDGRLVTANRTGKLMLFDAQSGKELDAVECGTELTIQRQGLQLADNGRYVCLLGHSTKQAIVYKIESNRFHGPWSASEGEGTWNGIKAQEFLSATEAPVAVFVAPNGQTEDELTAHRVDLDNLTKGELSGVSQFGKSFANPESFKTEDIFR